MTFNRPLAVPLADARALADMLTAARERMLGLAEDLWCPQLLGQRLSIVNPPLWEIGHLGWFQERWCLRTAGDGTLAPSMLAGADALYDSAAVSHDTRWDLPLPTLPATLAYLRAVLDRVRERLEKNPESGDLAYFVQLAALHEEMHAEAFTYTRQTLEYTAPSARASTAEAAAQAGPWPGDVDIPGGQLMLGAQPGSGFVFDNEKWAHPVAVQPFRIARAPVTNVEFAAFVDDHGYMTRAWWTDEGWKWREAASASHPVYWRRDGGWCERHYDEVRPLALHLPVMHVNWHEAQAYCRWAGRRLPTETEWECAAVSAFDDRGYERFPWGDAEPDSRRANLYGMANGRVDVSACAAGDSAGGCRQMIGNVWEWTASTFEPYPGFVADPYKEYSQPWFGDHKVLRGGCHATRAVLIRSTWRNFYTPDRSDVFAGFRTCAQ